MTPVLNGVPVESGFFYLEGSERKERRYYAGINSCLILLISDDTWGRKTGRRVYTKV